MAISPLKSFALIVSGVDRLLPLVFKRFIYRIPYWISKSLLRNDVSIWLRNSVYFDEMVFPSSDIDLTCFFSKNYSSGNVRKLQRHFSFMKKLFPHIGEVAYINAVTLQEFAVFSNSFELARDPLLMSKLERDEDENQRIQKIVFILRWLESDHHQLIQKYSARGRKIQRFFKILGMQQEVPGDLEVFLSLIFKELENLGLQNSEYTEFLRAYLKESSCPSFSLIDYVNEQPEVLPLLGLLLPHRWIGLPLEIRGENLKLTNDKLALKEVIEKQISWEVWGLYTQLSQGQRSADVIAHISALRDFANSCDFPKVHVALSSLEELYSESWSHKGCSYE